MAPSFENKTAINLRTIIVFWKLQFQNISLESESLYIYHVMAEKGIEKINRFGESTNEKRSMVLL
jgi:hypothetical protein